MADLLLDQKNYQRADSIVNDGLAKDSLNTAYLKLRVRSCYDREAYAAILAPGETLLRLEDGSGTVFTQLGAGLLWFENVQGQ